MKVGDKVDIDGEEMEVVHVTPSYPANCNHDWEYAVTADGEEPSHCTKCGISFTRYIFCECP
jgi:hypothetical protein